jgi:hypothetical protein
MLDDAAEQIKLLRHRIERLERIANDSGRLIDQHAEVINQALASSTNTNTANNFLERCLTFVEEAYEAGQTYTTVVIGGGYAAMFTLWSYLQDSAEHQLIAFSGGCMLLSVAVFVLTEVSNVVLRALGGYALAKLPKPTSVEEAGSYLIRVGAVMQRHGTRPGIYLAQVVLTLIPGLIAAGILLYLFTGQVLA